MAFRIEHDQCKAGRAVHNQPVPLFALAETRFHLLPLSDVADVTLNDALAILVIPIADHLYRVAVPRFVLERQVVVAQDARAPEILERGSACGFILQQTYLEQFLPEELVMGAPQEFRHEGIRVHNLSRPRINEEDTVLGSLEEPPVTIL